MISVPISGVNSHKMQHLTSSVQVSRWLSQATDICKPLAVAHSQTSFPIKKGLGPLTICGLSLVGRFSSSGDLCRHVASTMDFYLLNRISLSYSVDWSKVKIWPAAWFSRRKTRSCRRWCRGSRMTRHARSFLKPTFSCRIRFSRYRTPSWRLPLWLRRSANLKLKLF